MSVIEVGRGSEIVRIAADEFKGAIETLFLIFLEHYIDNAA